jgi:hypothetical protein
MAVATVVVMVAVVTVTVAMAAKKKKKGMPFCARQTSLVTRGLDRCCDAPCTRRTARWVQKRESAHHIRTENVIAIQTNSGTGTRKRISDWYFKRRPVCALVSKPAC